MADETVDEDVSVIDSGDENAHAPSSPVLPGLPFFVGDLLDDRKTAGGKGFSVKGRTKENIDAIRTLKKIEEEGRAATDAERRILVRYSGWGGVAESLEYGSKSYDEIQDLLTREEFRDALSSTTNAHFTSPDVIRAVWDSARKMGFSGGRVLEPSMGVGHFFGLAPRDLAEKTKFFGVEIDSISARISKALYGETARIFHSGFEDVAFPVGYFDLVIGNVPFGNYKVYDPTGRIPGQSIHNFFLMKSLDMIHPGGLAILLTSRYTMDAESSRTRTLLSEKFGGKLVGAFRLPSGSMKSQANTEAVIDILVFQKSGGTKMLPVVPFSGWEKSRKIDGEGPEDDRDSVNSYFLDHPERVFGRVYLGRGMYRANEVKVDVPDDLSDRIAGIPAALPSATRDIAADAVLDDADSSDLSAYGYDREGAYVIMGEKIAQVSDRKAVVFKTSPGETAFYRTFIDLRETVRSCLERQAKGQDGAADEARERMNRLYDELVVLAGKPLSDPSVLDRYEDDPDSPLILSLEDYDPETGVAEKSAIFRENILRAPETVEAKTPMDALLASIGKYGEIRPDYVSELLSRPWNEIVKDLGDSVYNDPSEGRWVTKDEYLTGNVREKLDMARRAMEHDPEMARNVAALEPVIPKDLMPSQIGANLGVPWIDPDFVSVFVSDMLADFERGRSYRTDVSVEYSKVDAQWRIALASTASAYMYRKWGTDRVDMISLLEQCMNQKTATVYDVVKDGDTERRVLNVRATEEARSIQTRMREKFRTWIWEDPDRAKAVMNEYNRLFNSVVLRKYDGSSLDLPGMSSSVSLRPHQKDAIMRCLQTRDSGVLLAHAVGAGKTMEMIGAAMKMKELGISKKSVMVVPNHLLEQTAAEIKKMYPLSNVLAMTKRDGKKENRRRFIAKAATGAWDLIVMSHSSFSRIPVSSETERAIIEERLWEYHDILTDENGGRGGSKAKKRSLKNIESAKKRLEVRLKELSKLEAKDPFLTWDAIGADSIIVDEAHLFKGLEIVTSMRIPGLTTTASQRALDLYMKAWQIRRNRTDGRGLIFATGTPITNSMAELYNLNRYLDPKGLADRGVSHFNAWVSTFGEPVTALELSPEGGSYRENTRLSKFVNIPEMMTLYWSFSDVKRRADLNLPVPDHEMEVIESDRSRFLEMFMRELGERAENVRGKSVDPTEDNMLKISGDGRKAALSINMIDPMLPMDPTSKVYRAAENIFSIWERTSDRKLAQMVFCDMGTPSEDETKYNVYSDLKQTLVRLGIPPEEVAFIHDADTDEAKESLFEKVRNGSVRVIVGSTEKMGAGTNVQNKLVALHDLDAPWRPADLEQRHGRILRQGNENDRVHIYTYVTKESFDLFMWETLKRKAGFINQIENGDKDVRTVDESLDPSYAEVMAIVTGNPLIRRKIEIDIEIMRSKNLKGAFEDAKFRTISEIGMSERILESTIKRRAEFERHLKFMKDPPAGEFPVEIGGKVYRDKESLKSVLFKTWQSAAYGDRIGSVCGMTIRKMDRWRTNSDNTRELVFNGMILETGMSQVSEFSVSMANISEDNEGLAVRRLEDRVRNRVKDLEAVIAAEERTKERIAEMRKIISEPFPGQEKIEMLEKELTGIIEKLSADIEKKRALSNESHYGALILRNGEMVRTLSDAISTDTDSEIFLSDEGYRLSESLPWQPYPGDVRLYGRFNVSFPVRKLLDRMMDVLPGGDSDAICLSNLGADGRWTINGPSRLPYPVLDEVPVVVEAEATATVNEEKSSPVFEIPVSRNALGIALAQATDLASGKLSSKGNPFSSVTLELVYVNGSGSPSLDICSRNQDVFSANRVNAYGRESESMSLPVYRTHMAWKMTAEESAKALSNLRQAPEIVTLSWKTGSLVVSFNQENKETVSLQFGQSSQPEPSIWTTMPVRPAGKVQISDLSREYANGDVIGLSEEGAVSSIVNMKNESVALAESSPVQGWVYPSRIRWTTARMQDDLSFAVVRSKNSKILVFEGARDGASYRMVIAPMGPAIESKIRSIAGTPRTDSIASVNREELPSKDDSPETARKRSSAKVKAIV